MKKGALIVFEGIDGSGKTTQLKLFQRYLTERGLSVISTREPGGTEIGEHLRSLSLSSKLSPMLDTCLMYTSRLLHVQELIKPVLESGTHILCDRFVSSTWAYQGKTENRPHGVDLTVLNNLENSLYDSGAPVPLVEIFLSVPLDVAKNRRAERGELSDKFEADLMNTYKGYETRYRDYPPRYPCTVIDGTSSVSEVAERVHKCFNRFSLGTE